MVEPISLFRRTDTNDPPARVAHLRSASRRSTYRLADVARPLALSGFAIRTIIEKLRLLAEHDDMPLPRTPRFVDGRLIKGPRAIYSHSEWDAGEFDAWLDGRHPGAPSVAQIPVAGTVRQDMKRRAERLAGAA